MQKCSFFSGQRPEEPFDHDTPQVVGAVGST